MKFLRKLLRQDGTFGLTDILERIHKKSGKKELSIKDVLDALHNKGFGPLLLAPVLLILLPTGVLPGVPTLAATLIFLTAGQILVGRERPWLPQKIETRSFPKAKFDKGYKKVLPYTRKFDKLLKPRLQVFVTPVFIKIIAVLFILMAMMMPPFEFIPMGSDVLAIIMFFFAMGISTNDGLLVLIGFLLFATSACLGVVWMI